MACTAPPLSGGASCYLWVIRGPDSPYESVQQGYVRYVKLL